jgi:hypothetical protein
MQDQQKVIERLRAQIQRYGLDTGDDKTEVLEDDGVVLITSECGEDVEIDDPEELAAALEALPDDAPIEECGGPEGTLSVWDVILDHGGLR